MTSPERIKCLFESLEYVRLNNIPGDFVECGVWKGGNILGAAAYFKYFKLPKRVWGYDTFEGMTQCEPVDVDYAGASGNDWTNQLVISEIFVSELFKNIDCQVELIKGDVCETLLSKIPESICILRLDTDWYKSTKAELEILYPIVNSKGILIVDDYGHWRGSRQAVDEFFNDSDVKKEMIDYTGLKIVKS
jgi:hypothetical protein